MDLSNNRSFPCFFPIRFLTDMYLIGMNRTLIMPNDELSEQLLDSSAMVFLFVFPHKYQIGLYEARFIKPGKNRSP